MDNLNDIDQLSEMKVKYKEYYENENNRKEFLNSENILYKEKIIKIIKKLYDIKNSKNIFIYENVPYIIKKNSIYDINLEPLGKVNTNKIVKFIKDKDIYHRNLKQIVDQIEIYDKLKIEILTHIKNNNIKVDENEEYKNIPDYNDIDMIKKISEKVEFNTKILDKEDSCDKVIFKLKPSQIFLKNYISKNTKYNSILLFHGTGTGKTCSGITIAENFKIKSGKKHIILCPKNVIQNWKKTIYDYKKGDEQCTGDKYDNNILERKNIENESRSLINKKYEIMGYRKFSNLISSKLELDLSDNKINKYQIDIIRENFNNRVIIIDEVHNIRDETNDKDIMKLLKIITKYSLNVKLILLSATPMFNNSLEIVNIINLMLTNDKRDSELLIKNDIFDESGKLIDGINKNGQVPINLISNILKGYVSYSRGENYDTFPIRLYPNNTINFPLRNFKNKDIDIPLKFLKLYGSRLDDIKGSPPYKGNLNQTKIYYNELNKIKDKENLQIDDEIKFMQISNITYPSDKFYTGYQGLNFCMNITTKENSILFKYKKSIIDKFGPIFSPDIIENYSKKIYNIINIIKKSKGIVFIYTQYVKSGIIPIALALEHMGFGKYQSEDLLKYENKPKKIGNYIILSSSDKLSKNMEKELEMCNSFQNRNGENIKVILATSVASEGLDFKNIRMVHILDPWHHLNRLEQVIGRGIRYCSHTDLLEKERNVMVFLHALTTYDNLTETTDINIYRLAEYKAKNIGIIENILKINAVDCNIFNKVEKIKEMNIEYPLYESGNLINKKLTIKDEPYSKICSYSDICNYKCRNNDISSEKNFDTLDINLFKPVLYEICDYIKDLYKEKYIYTLEEIIGILRDKKIICMNEVIYLSLHLLITEKSKKTQLLINNNSGYINYIGNVYIFKPENIKDPNIPFIYRYIKKNDKKKYIDIKTIKKVKNIKKTVKLENINLDMSKLEYFKKEFDIEDKYLIDYLIERLTLEDKQSILNNIIIELYNTNKINPNNINIFNHFKRNLIYKGSDVNNPSEYVYDLEIKEDIKPIGYYLYDGTTLIYHIYKDGEIKILNKQDEIVSNMKKWLLTYKDTAEYKVRYIDFIKGKIWGYIFTNTKKEYIFKFVDKNNNSKPGFRAKGHRDCNGQQTGDLTRDILIELNSQTKTECINSSINSKLYEKQKSGSNISRSTKCIYLELIMRKNNLIYNYDNVSMMKI